MTDIDPKALALRVAAEVCHEDQMIVWSSEFAEALQEFISDDLDYSDIVALHSAIDRGLRDIVRCALEHPETERALAAFLRETGSPWRPIDEAKKDGTIIWAKLRDDIYPALEPTRDDLDRWNGVQVPLRHPGVADDGFDIGWSVAAPVGHGGFPDEWIEGFMPLPTPPARIEDAEEPSHDRR